MLESNGGPRRNNRNNITYYKRALPENVERRLLDVGERIRGRAQETLIKLHHMADSGSPLNLDALNEIIRLGGSFGRKECFPEGVDLDPTKVSSVGKAISELERVRNETTMGVPLGENGNGVSLKAKLNKSVKELVTIGKEILVKIPIGTGKRFQNQFTGSETHDKKLNALYVLEELRTMQTYPFRSLGDVSLVTFRAETLLEDRSYPSSSRGGDVYEGSDKLYYPTDEQKERIRSIIQDLLSSAEDARERADQKIKSDSKVQKAIKKKLASLIRIGQEVMDNTQVQTGKDLEAMHIPTASGSAENVTAARE